VIVYDYAGKMQLEYLNLPFRLVSTFDKLTVFPRNGTSAMQLTPNLIPTFFAAINTTLQNNAEEIAALDQEIGDGDHLFNLQRGMDALDDKQTELEAVQNWKAAFQVMGMTVMSSVGGASGSLYGTLLLSLSRALDGSDVVPADFAHAFSSAVDAVKQRGKADAGEKTMLDVLIPVAEILQQQGNADLELSTILQSVADTAQAGMESTRDMLATKGRASFLGERSIGHIDPGARTAQLMICAICEVLATQRCSPL
jgi:dihydroxyacetone kinase-like protein